MGSHDTGYSQATTQQKLEVAALASQLQAMGLDASSIIEEENASSTAKTSREFYAELKPHLEQILAFETEQRSIRDTRQDAGQQSGAGESRTTSNSAVAPSAPQENGAVRGDRSVNLAGTTAPDYKPEDTNKLVEAIRREVEKNAVAALKLPVSRAAYDKLNYDLVIPIFKNTLFINESADRPHLSVLPIFKRTFCCPSLFL